MGIILLATSSVIAQDTIINQDFLLDPEAEKMLSPNEEAIINAEVEKFKFHRKDINFIIDVDKKSKYCG